ncbi:MAG: D-glycerate dehydrogenase [Acidobacteria bacterium CG_4_9_14_3_um_filter_49_7]|nr:MAG: D-glycerate dehydrogenase [Acidobacteria bacterium CG_4_9_14_3_um_filter_49_7]
MKVFVTKRIPEAGIRFLSEKGYEVVVREEPGLISPDELIRGLRDFDGMISMLSDPIGADILSEARKCRVIANYAVGTNNINIKVANKQGIAITNTPNVLTEATAELAMALLLAASRRIVEADRFAREGKFQGWGPLLLTGKGLDGKTVGIVGMGRIGQAFARMVSGFNAQVLYYSRTKQPVPYPLVDFETLLKESDFISLHLPLTPESRHMFTQREFTRMKTGVVFINTARGPVVREKDLVNALNSGKIAYSGLDVYEFEPNITEELKTMDNVVLLPHIGSATEKARNDMAILAAGNVNAVLKGEAPLTPVQVELE